MLSRAVAAPVLAASVAALGGPFAAPAAPAAPPSLAAQVRADEGPALAALRLRAAWKVSEGRGVTVAVLDTGVDPAVPDLAGSVATGPDYTRGADPPGYRPPRLHGTFIASLIAGHGSGPGRADGVIGAAPEARILSVRVLLDDGEPGFAVYNENPRFADAIARGIRYATDHGARVINMSLGSPAENRDTRAALAYAIGHGVVIVAAAGNDAKPGQRYTPYSYPAAYPGVIGVAAVGSPGRPAAFSDRNSSVVISAPGVGIVGAGPGGSYLRASGTSPASAFVAGVAALIRSRYPSLPAALVKQALIVSARRVPRRGYSPDVGFGEVDAASALAAGRLAAQRPDQGLAPSAQAAPGGAGPIPVTRRDVARIAAYDGAAGASGLACLACLALLAISWRSRRPRSPAHADAGALGRAQAGAPPSDWPPL